MIYTVEVNNSGAEHKMVVTTSTEIGAIAEAVIRAKNGGCVPSKRDPGGEFYLN